MKEYQVKCPWGILIIQNEINGTVVCSLRFRNGLVLHQSVQTEKPVQLLLPFTHVQKAQQFVHRVEKIICRILKAVVPVPIRQPWLLEFCVVGDMPAVELLESCPAMALLLALKAHYTTTYENHIQIAALARCKRSEILWQCSFPSQKWVTGLLKKIPASQCSSHLLEGLKIILRLKNKEHIKILQHIKLLNSLVVNVMIDPGIDKLVGSNFYHSASFYPEIDGDIEIVHLIKEIKRFHKEARIVGGIFTIPRAQSIRDLERIHGLYIEHVFTANMRQYQELELPAPPIPSLTKTGKCGEYGILPLSSGKKLYSEGIKLHHCIASYAETIAAGNSLYAYHVVTDESEEATILIKKRDKLWRLVEIRGYCNREVSSRAVLFVDEWLTAYNEF